MAARLPLRTSRPPPSAVAAAPALHVATRIHPLGRRGPPPSVSLRMQQARKRDPPFRSNCAQRAEEPEQEPEPEHHESDKAASSGNCELVDMMLKRVQAAKAEMGIFLCSPTNASISMTFIKPETPTPPDMFVAEKERMSSWLTSSRATEDVGEMASMVCECTHEALNLASLVMDIARLRPGTIQFCQHTVDQMVRTYAAIFCNVAEDVYYKKFNTETAFSFLGALRGLGAICHILAQDTASNLKDGRFKDSITNRMCELSQFSDKMMKYSEGVIVKIDPQQYPRKATGVLLEGLHHARVYVSLLAECRESALGYLKASYMMLLLPKNTDALKNKDMDALLQRYFDLFTGPLTDLTLKALVALCGLEDPGQVGQEMA
ncbi:hypothetical protein U9M48_021224 [Paspalum notatum var. saurae]|uniref:Uncharacterized protein n=1 Tax=Paspalum notatum var. saurae TaxID=547442 RepID=A0AAQ3WSR0_PASNO